MTAEGHPTLFVWRETRSAENLYRRNDEGCAPCRVDLAAAEEDERFLGRENITLLLVGEPVAPILSPVAPILSRIIARIAPTYSP